tara:strand:+ start:1156 stop:1563 length:408 start_codon:yes stop_codon:yes gene_type:complete
MGDIQGSAIFVRRKINRKQSQLVRDRTKDEFELKRKSYNLLNSLCGVFPPQKWVLTEFKSLDVPLVGDRKEKNRIASRNSRIRAKCMHLELDRRLSVLEMELEPRYEAPMNFVFPFDDIKINLGGCRYRFGNVLV